MFLYGKPVAEKIYQQIQNEIKLMQKKPFLAVILVGDDPASLTYVKVKERKANELGIGFKLFHFPEIVPQKELEKLITDLNINEFINGIVVQLPLPNAISSDEIIKLIDPKKDIDGFLGNHPAPTAQAILDIFKFYQIGLASKEIVIIGHGRLVGAPLEKLLLKQGITASICDSKTTDLKEKTLSADILISAVGCPGLITEDMVKEGAIIVDAGTSEVSGKMIGDVTPEVYQKVASYTPNPGGVGPVTVAELFNNLVMAVK